MAFEASQGIRALLAGIGCVFGLTATLRAADLAIGHVEITQGLQTESNDIPLIRDKPTVIRVFPVVTGQPELRQVSARLHAIRAGQSLPGSPMRPTRGTATIGNTVDRTTDQAALIFELPPEWYAEDTQFLIEAVPPAGFTDDDPTNDRFPRTGFQQATFVESGSLSIRFLTVRYKNGGPDALPASVVTRRDAVEWLQAVFPIAPERVSYRPWLTTELVFQNPGPPSLSGGTRELNGAALISELNTIWTEGQSPPEILFAWTPADSFIVNGNSDPWYTLPPLPPGLGQVAFANSNAETYQRTLAHEVAHNLGINCHHSSRLNGSAIGYDVSLVHPLNASTSVLRLGASGGGLFDVMTPEQVEADAWIVPSTYRQLLAALTSNNRQSIQCDSNPPLVFAGPPLAPGKPVVPGSPLVAIRGEVRADGGSFFHSYEVRAAGPYLVAASRTPDGGQGTHEVRILNRTGGMLRSIRWTPPVQHGDSTSPLDSTPFTWFVPRSDEVGAVLLLRGATVLDTLRVSDRKPVIEPPQRSTVRDGPAFGGRPQELLTVKWREVSSGPGGNPFDQKELRHRLSFSRDGGETWIPVAANISGSQEGQVSLEFNQALLPGCQSCRLKVTTSDGYNVTETIGQPFTLPNRPPLAEVVSPSSKIKIRQGDLLRLAGEAFDPEDGPLAGDQLVWWSVTQGDLGRGTVLKTASLPPGIHQVQLTANDKDHETSDPAFIEVEVLPADQP